jgi:hypothetical protein
MRESQTHRAQEYEHLLDEDVNMPNQRVSPIIDPVMNTSSGQYPEMVKERIPQKVEEQQSILDEPIVRRKIILG